MASDTAAVRAAPGPDRFLLAIGVGFVVCLALLPVELDTLTGLPAHPLLLHVPVIFLPLTALGTIAVAFRADWRERYAPWLAGAALIALAGTVLAVGAGEKWRDSGEGGPGIAHHADLGGQLRIIAFVFVALLLVRLALDRLGRLRTGAAALALSVVLVAGAAVTAAWTYRTGHAGAKQTFGERGGGPPEGGFPGGGGAPPGGP